MLTGLWFFGSVRPSSLEWAALARGLSGWAVLWFYGFSQFVMTQSVVLSGIDSW
jgi:hypothetical protein